MPPVYMRLSDRVADPGVLVGSAFRKTSDTDPYFKRSTDHGIRSEHPNSKVSINYIKRRKKVHGEIIRTNPDPVYLDDRNRVNSTCIRNPAFQGKKREKM